MADELLSNIRKPYRFNPAASEGSMHHAAPAPALPNAGRGHSGCTARRRVREGDR